MSNTINKLVNDDEDIIFKWVRGDDELETLIFFNDDDTPMDFTGSQFDLHIAPERSQSETIKLSTSNGLTVKDNEITLHVSHDQTENADWKEAVWDLQETNKNGFVDTLCGGKVWLKREVTRGRHENRD